jgi:HEXXH motif-containing protein
MLSTPDEQQAVALRQAFTATVVTDWRKVIAFVERWAGLPTAQARQLTDALDEVSDVGGPSRSEFFHRYLLALDQVNKEDRDGARAMVTSLGNVLLQDAAEGRVSGALPVLHTDRGVPLPAAAPDAVTAVRPRNGVVDPSEITAHGDEIRRLIDATWLARASAGRTMGVRGLTAPIAGEIDKYDDRMSELAGGPSNLRMLDVDRGRGGDVVDRLQAGYRLLDSIDPVLAAEIAIVTEYVVLLDGVQFIGGSDLILYGASFLRLLPEWTPLCFADHIIHEEAHQLLHAAQELEPLLLNREQTGQPSPIRSDSRPLYGTFHATFVFLRLASFMRKVVQSSDDAFRSEAEVRLHRHLLGLLQGLQILVEHGEFSERGNREIDAWVAQAKGLVSDVGEPDPRFYARLDEDYEAANDELPLLAV